MKLLNLYKFSTFLLIIATIVTGYYVWNHYFLYTRVAYIDTAVVTISPQVAGDIAQIYVKDLQPVKKGQLLLTINDQAFKKSLAAAQANVKIQETNYQGLSSKLTQQQHALSQAQSKAQFALKEWERYKLLASKQMTSKELLGAMYVKWVQAQQQVEILQSAVSLLERIVGKSILDYAPYQLAIAKQKLAMIKLKYSQITAPISGYVTGLNLSEGDYVNVGQNLFSLIDANHWWVTANVLEKDLTGIQGGEPVTITVPSLGGMRLKATVYGTAWGVDRQDHPYYNQSRSALPYVPRTIDWIQLEQRFPVRFNFVDLPPNIHLRIGATAHVFLRKHYAQ